MRNEMNLQFSALSQNESFARVTVAAFIAQLTQRWKNLRRLKQLCQKQLQMQLFMGTKEMQKVLFIFL